MKNKLTEKVLLSVCIAAALGTTNVSADRPSQAKPFDLEINIPPGLLRDRLGSLPDAARQNARSWLGEINYKEQDLPFLRLDDEGGVYFADTFLPEPSYEKTDAVSGDASTPASAGSIDVFTLHSKPNASKVIYIDFDGHLVSGTAWSSTDLNAVAYDLDGDMTSFSTAEEASMAEIWRRIAEDYAPFDVDVTTEEPASFGANTGRLLITKDVDANGVAMPAQGAGGVAYVNVFGRSDYPTRYSPAFVYYDNLGGGRADYVTEAASHEMGHNMGLSHDATSTSSYYGGHGTGYTSWGPIMGTGYNRNVSQWSKGEYTDASQQEDDLAIIAGKVSYRADDHGNQTSQATPLTIDAAGNITSTTAVDDPANTQPENKGIIGSRDDIDIFMFTTAGGNVVLQATPAREPANTRGGNLDVLLSLYDQSGTLLGSVNPAIDTDAGINTTVSAGTYYLSIQGTDSANYTDYGSLGQYAIEGVLPAVVDDTTAPNPNPMGWATAPTANDRSSISMTATTATDDISNVEYYFACTSGNCADSAWQSATQYIATGLDAATTYSFSVKARDQSGNETIASEILLATTLSNTAPVAGDDAGTASLATPISLNVLGNDTDADGDTLSVTSVTQASNGSVTYTDNNVTYTPNAGFSGTDGFTYTISDGQGGSATANVVIDVVDNNNAPVASNDTGTVNNTSSLTLSVLANDNDADGDNLSVTSVTQAANGSVAHSNSDVTYTPSTGFVGVDSFTYTISDGKGGNSTATVTVDVTETPVVNETPIASDDTATVVLRTSVTIDVLANDSDPEGDTLSITSVTQGSKGSVSTDGGQITYVAGRKRGGDSFTYTISDGNGNTATATVNISITRSASDGGDTGGNGGGKGKKSR